MNGTSVVKCRIPDTHYRPRVKEMEYQAQSERHELKDKEIEMVRESVCEKFIFCVANIVF